jgi:ribosomal protein S18 acetylase RimI-like enzyme
LEQSQLDPIIDIVEADLNRPDHQRDVVALTAAYALEPTGNGGPLPPDVLDQLISGLQNHPTTLIFLAYKDGRAIGIATCFRGFSTFAAKPLINISDLAILPAHRGQGVGRQLLAAVEQKAREADCCRITLEVQENNEIARHTYQQAGFSQAVYGPTTGASLYYWKKL